MHPSLLLQHNYSRAVPLFSFWSPQRAGGSGTRGQRLYWEHLRPTATCAPGSAARLTGNTGTHSHVNAWDRSGIPHTHTGSSGGVRTPAGPSGGAADGAQAGGAAGRADLGSGFFRGGGSERGAGLRAGAGAGAWRAASRRARRTASSHWYMDRAHFRRRAPPRAANGGQAPPTARKGPAYSAARPAHSAAGPAPSRTRHAHRPNRPGRESHAHSAAGPAHRSDVTTTEPPIGRSPSGHAHRPEQPAPD